MSDNDGGQAFDEAKLQAYRQTVRDGQAIAIETMVEVGMLSAAEAEAQLKVLVAQGSLKAEEILLRITRQRAQ